MALLYYPKGSILARRDASNPYYEELIISTSPNMVYYFDTSSVINAASASNLFITASWAQTASISITFASSSQTAVTASYAQTASVALNALGGGGVVGSASSSFYLLEPQSAKLYTTKSAVLNNGVVCWELLFAEGAVASWQMRMPAGYTSSLTNTIQWYATASNAGLKQVLWNVYLTTVSPGSQTVVSQSNPNLFLFGMTSSFQQSGSVLQQTTFYLTGSPITASDFLIYKLERSTGSADTAVGPIAVVSNTLEWLKS